MPDHGQICKLTPVEAGQCLSQPAGVLGPSHQSVGEQALVAAVLGTGAAQESLVPALMGAYAAADHVVGCAPKQFCMEGTVTCCGCVSGGRLSAIPAVHLIRVKCAVDQRIHWSLENCWIVYHAHASKQQNCQSIDHDAHMDMSSMFSIKACTSNT